MKIACVLVDNRPLNYLNNVIKNFLYHLPENDPINDFDFFLHTCIIDYNFLDPEIKSIITLKKVLPERNFNHTAYDFYLTSKEFWAEYLNYDRVLIFQHDSLLIRTGLFSESIIQTTPFIGATVPIKNLDNIPKEYELMLGGTIQNGGLSVRNPKVMMEILNKTSYLRYSDDLCEDSFFSLFTKSRPHSIFYEYSPYDRLEVLKSNKFYGVHLNTTNINNDKMLRFSKDAPYLIDVPYSNHLFSYEYNFLNHHAVHQQILKDQVNSIELNHLEDYWAR